jgi:pyruvate dehydrogenase E1 component
LTEVIQAAQGLAERGIGVDVYSITSWSELARDGMAHDNEGAESYVNQLLSRSVGPILAATDYVRAVPESVRAFLPQGRSYRTLGTDGFGRSDTRAVLRSFFKVNAASIVSHALDSLAKTSIEARFQHGG